MQPKLFINNSNEEGLENNDETAERGDGPISKDPPHPGNPPGDISGTKSSPDEHNEDQKEADHPLRPSRHDPTKQQVVWGQD